MGVTAPIDEYERDVLSSLGWKYKGLKWCEFGSLTGYRHRTAKEVYKSRGVQHTSMDLNAKFGLLSIDLGRPMPIVYINQFDVVTNYGTIEHVNNQFEAFKNAHDMCKEGGIMIHVFPLIGNWLGHGRYYFSEKFVMGLADACDYHVIKCVILNQLGYRLSKNVIAVTYVKKKSSRFVTRKEFSRIEGVIDSGNLKHTGDYNMKGKRRR